MLNFTDDTMWLNITNIALGLVVAAGCLVVFRVFAAEIFGKVRETLAARTSEHELFVSDLGLTMADGGERVDEKAKKNDTELSK